MPRAAERWVAAAGDLLLGAALPRLRGGLVGSLSRLPGRAGGASPALDPPDPCPAGFPPTVTSSPYDPILRGLINAHKEHQALGLTRVLADRLALSVHACSPRGRPGSAVGAGPGAVGGPGRPASAGSTPPWP